MKLPVARAHEAAARCDTDATERAIARWLLNGGVQLTTGPHAGGVAGAIGADGRAVYVYAEVTGYYLQWLAWHEWRHGSAPAVSERATAAQRWLTAWIARTDPPETRIYLRAHRPDWRNSATFFFDLAMIVRGIASATVAKLIKPDKRLVTGCVAQLSRLLASDGTYAACLAASPSSEAPHRWSTLGGGFLAKAAAGVLTAGRILPLPANILSAAQVTFAASMNAAIERPHVEVHPQLYAIEGALAMAAHPTVAPLLPHFASQIDALLLEVGEDGRLPESRSVVGTDRLDIVAQCLRAARLLRIALPSWSPDELALLRLRQKLLRNVNCAGAAFRASTKGAPFSVWAAMFAEQALVMERSDCDGVSAWAHRLV